MPAAALGVVGAVALAYRGEGLPWSTAWLAAACFVAPCALLAWLAWSWLARAGAARPGLPTHALGALAFAGAWTAAFTLAVHVLRPGEADDYLRGSAAWQALWGLVIYGALAIAARLWRRGEAQRAAASQAELVALRAQLSPHFLFNTLHSLTQLAREDPRATEAALERFGGLMRYVLAAASRAGEVPLEAELAFVRDYLALERLRLGERLAVVEDVDPEALDCAVPPLVLQPLAENAIRHGLAVRRRGGTLALRARLEGEMLLLEVADDGAGATAIDPARSPGLGLRSAARLLDAFAPGRATLAIDAAPGAGCRVRLLLPARAPRRERAAC